MISLGLSLHFVRLRCHRLPGHSQSPRNLQPRHGSTSTVVIQKRNIPASSPRSRAPVFDKYSHQPIPFTRAAATTAGPTTTEPIGFRPNYKSLGTNTALSVFQSKASPLFHRLNAFFTLGAVRNILSIFQLNIHLFPVSRTCLGIYEFGE